MTKLLGYTLTAIGLIALVFFLTYNGTVIPLKELWFVLSLFILTGGIYFIIKLKLQAYNNHAESNENLVQVYQLKFTGEKIMLTLDNIEVKTRSYQREIVDNSFPSRVKMLDALYDSNRNFETKEIQQIYIVFYKQYGNKIHQFISQPSTQSADALKRYIENQRHCSVY